MPRYPASQFHVLDLAAGIADRKGELGLPRSGADLSGDGEMARTLASETLRIYT